MKPIALGSDEAGSPLRRRVAALLREDGVPFVDFGCDDGSCDYPEVARVVAERVADGTHDRAILTCGTGIGVAIAANKVPGVYAALCHDVYSAERARKSNDAQVLTMGARVVGPEHAAVIVRAWLASEFEGGASAPKVAALRALERELLGGEAALR
jgi:ribose 5-phosphate isomerase B